ncbi:DUF481 domain-containing protein [Maribacter hydrothermalis]|uniref:DUF481 domain-containing protein n=1 Tax=Maribacter hydrothermalis TaxID=1836467 RepID=A0A1B7Z702_9FLAO|nr:DUF481 domain-containing protein [Maribacter hydrothermalis]APQ16387.1 hypothetical protein BTR34_03105 [Maribacter hydrothermalis]OBR38489.1 hypothetical protein A9200_17615 [Maribacter hydrothermalis]
MKVADFLKQGVLFFILIVFSIKIAGQRPPVPENNQAPRLFIECNCDRSYIQQEIKFVNHVRDQSLANIQLFIFDVTNGSGGRTYVLEFKGVDGYEGIFNKLSYDTSPNMTSDEVRQGLLKHIKTGLLRYLIESDLVDKIDYTVENEGAEEMQDIDFEDPWNNWIFEVYGEARLDKESSRKEFEYEVGFESDRVTEKWRIRTDVEMNQEQSEFEQNQEIFTSSRKRYSFNGSVVRSLSDHWSLGLFGGVRHNTFTNLDFSTYVNPAIEYNIFPYKEVLRREIVFAYKIGYFFNDYINTTIFNKNSEGIFNHSLNVQLNYRQPWGTVYARLQGSTFLEDFERNRLEFYGRFSIRVFKGLAVSFSGNYDLVKDQIGLPAGDATIEDVLLQQKQIATAFELGFRVGLRYTFGSAYNNIINLRL